MTRTIGSTLDTPDNVVALGGPGGLSRKPRNHAVAYVIAGLVAGAGGSFGLNAAPAVFVEGTAPTDLPDGACEVVKTGLLEGLRVCDVSKIVSAGGTVIGADGTCEWTCTTRDAVDPEKCALMECVAVKNTDSLTGADAGVEARKDAGVLADVPPAFDAGVTTP